MKIYHLINLLEAIPKDGNVEAVFTKSFEGTQRQLEYRDSNPFSVDGVKWDGKKVVLICLEDAE